MSEDLISGITDWITRVLFLLPTDFDPSILFAYLVAVGIGISGAFAITTIASVLRDVTTEIIQTIRQMVSNRKHKQKDD